MDSMELLFDSFSDALIDSVKLIPFLLVTYLLMEWLEQRTEEKQKQYMQSAGAFGPLAGGVLGIVPQCGFSCVAANLYSGGVITAGVVLAVFMSTSDEMVPIFISHTVSRYNYRILLAKCALRSLQVMQSILQINISAEDIWQEEKRSIQRLQKR